MEPRSEQWRSMTTTLDYRCVRNCPGTRYICCWQNRWRSCGRGPVREVLLHLGSLFPFTDLVCALDSRRASPMPGIGNLPAPSILFAEPSAQSLNPMTTYKSVTATGGDLQVASAQSALRVDVTVPGSGRLGVFPLLVTLDSAVGVSDIPEPILRQVEARLPGVQVQMLRKESCRMVSSSLGLPNLSPLNSRCTLRGSQSSSTPDCPPSCSTKIQF